VPPQGTGVATPASQPLESAPAQSVSTPGDVPVSQ
jgi:hypothetical protein